MLEHVGGAVRHRLERGAREVRARRSAREPDDRSARVGLPVRRAESGQRGNEVHAVRRLDRARQRFGLARLLDDAESVAQPLHRGAGDEDRRLERVRRPAARIAGDRREQSVSRRGPLAPVFSSRNAPVPYVFLPVPRVQHPWPNSAAC